MAEEEEDDLEEFSKKDLGPSRFAINKDGSENPHAFRSGACTGASTPANNNSLKPPLHPHHLKLLDAAALRSKLPPITSRLSEESHADAASSEPSVVPSCSSGLGQPICSSGVGHSTKSLSDGARSSSGASTAPVSGALAHAYVKDVSMGAGAAGSGAAQVLTLVN